ncbi:MAG TPA: hypothetical protein VIF62_16865 [Labilithrix sp.]|jgi:hypothetical protein
MARQKSSPKKPASTSRRGTGAHGSRGTPAGRDDGPKWRGGGKKGENEQR